MPVSTHSSNKKPTIENVALNSLRTIAAFLVVLGHARTLMFLDYDYVKHTPINAIFYGLTALGHQAVIVFFVLSGYWVGRPAFSSIRNSTFKWKKYLTNRLVRLWIVLLPALALTLLFDTWGRLQFGQMSTYTGSARYGGVALSQNPLDITTFLGNFFFLGDIRVPTYGSNTALWSISYEFWMYIIPILGIWIALQKGRIKKIVFALVFLTICLLVGLQVIAYLPIWIAGALIPSSEKFPLNKWLTSKKRKTITAFLLLFTLCGTAVMIRGINNSNVLLGDYILAIPTLIAIWYFAKPNTQKASSAAGIAVNYLAGFSYSLYSYHMPALILLVSCLGIGVDNRLDPSLTNVILLLGICFALVFYSWTISLFTEKNTSKVRNAINTMGSRNNK